MLHEQVRECIIHYISQRWYSDLSEIVIRVSRDLFSSVRIQELRLNRSVIGASMNPSVPQYC